MANRHRFIFTSKKNPPQGIMSTILGVLSICMLVHLVLASFRAQGLISVREGAAMLLAFLFSIAGVVCGLVGKNTRNTFHLFCYIGIALNMIAFALCCVVLYIGMYS